MTKSMNFSLSLLPLIIALAACKNEIKMPPPSPFKSDLINQESHPQITFPSKMNPLFNSYVETFVEAGIKYLSDPDFDLGGVVIDFSKVPRPTTAAYCNYIHPRSIGINRIWWERASHLERENIIFHELGHCVLHRHHDNEEIEMTLNCDADHPVKTSIPKSIMTQKMMPENYYLKLRDEYWHELFQQDDSQIRKAVSCP